MVYRYRSCENLVKKQAVKEEKVMSPTTEKKLEDRLRYILASVVDMVKFAESKNAALMAASSALIFGIFTIIGQSPSLHFGIVIYLYIVAVFLGLGGITCLVSYIPQNSLPRLSSRRQPTRGKNLLFYGNLADLCPESFLKLLYEQSEIELKGIDPIEEDYAEQIIINSRIALLKFRYFTAAIWIILTGLVTPIGVVILYFIRKRQ